MKIPSGIEKRILHFLEGLGVQAVVAAPALIQSAAARNFVDHHPGLAVFFPLAASGVLVLSGWLKDRLVALGATPPAKP